MQRDYIQFGSRRAPQSQGMHQNVAFSCGMRKASTAPCRNRRSLPFPHPLNCPKTQRRFGRERSPVGRPVFKTGRGRHAVPGGFDSLSLPPPLPTGFRRPARGRLIRIAFLPASLPFDGGSRLSKNDGARTTSVAAPPIQIQGPCGPSPRRACHETNTHHASSDSAFHSRLRRSPRRLRGHGSGRSACRGDPRASLGQ